MHEKYHQCSEFFEKSCMFSRVTRASLFHNITMADSTVLLMTYCTLFHSLKTEISGYCLIFPDNESCHWDWHILRRIKWVNKIINKQINPFSYVEDDKENCVPNNWHQFSSDSIPDIFKCHDCWHKKQYLSE